jgi:putative ABC transport system permease protein
MSRPTGQWSGGWRLALRMARRDTRRHRGRAGLVVAMIGPPVALLTAGLILGATSTLNPTEAIPGVMGTSQAAVSYYPGATVVQDPLGNAASIEGSDGQGIDGEPVATAARRVAKADSGPASAADSGRRRPRGRGRPAHPGHLGRD